MQYDWGDIRVFLALLSQGTTGRAAEMLGCSQPTVVRRIAALEHALGLQLFDRTPTGFVPTEAGLALTEPAQSFERAACEFDSETQLQLGEDSPRVRLTLLDHFEHLLVPLLREFRAELPAVRVEILASDRMFDLGKAEADIAIRGRAAADKEAILVRRLPDCAWAIYSARDWGENECPNSWDELRNHVLALPDGAPAKLPVYRALSQLVASGGESIRCSTISALRSAVLSGTAVAALPVTIGDDDGRMKRCLPTPREFDAPIYLLARRAALKRPYVRRLFEMIYTYFSENPRLLSGQDLT